MVDRPKKPTALSTSAAHDSRVITSHSESRVKASLSTGESLEILLHGATIISWRNKEGKDLLWLSEASKLDGSRAVRGGVPLVFPVFGRNESHVATANLPQHGFARSSDWEYLGKTTSESSEDESVKLDFGLSPNNLTEESKLNWPFSFGLIYSVTFTPNELTTSLLIRNDGETAWDFQALIHTYFKIQDISAVEVTGLETAQYTDKTTSPFSAKTSLNEPLKVTSKIDRVYTVAENQKFPILILEKGTKKFGIIRDNMNEVVVWNPWSEGALEMSDFAPDDGYKQMICVEAGSVKDWIELQPGETWEGLQVISAF